MIEIRSFDPETILLLALINPVVIAVAVIMGRRADQWQKIPIAGFAAAIAGFALYWLVAQVGLMPVHALGSEGGLVLAQFVLGTFWAALAYRFFPQRQP